MRNIISEIRRARRQVQDAAKEMHASVQANTAAHQEHTRVMTELIQLLDSKCHCQCRKDH